MTSRNGFRGFDEFWRIEVLQGFDKAIFVIGPTASGKTALAHALFDRLPLQCGVEAELINLDALQFYRGVDVGSAKPTAAEVNHYCYHGIDILDPLESMDAVRYAEFVWSTCQNIRARGRMPICVGGSGLYLRSVLHGLDNLPPRNEALRQMFRASAEAWGWPYLHEWLKTLAPERAAQLHPNDKTRIERALEIVFQAPEGMRSEDLFRRSQKLSEQSTLGRAYIIHVDCPDEFLKTRISQRLMLMFASGWVDEVQRLRTRYGRDFLNSQAGQAIGYREIFECLSDGEGQGVSSSVSGLVERMATLTWQYVRRQRTWNAKECLDWRFDASQGIVDLQFPASFLSFITQS